MSVSTAMRDERAPRTRALNPSMRFCMVPSPVPAAADRKAYDEAYFAKWYRDPRPRPPHPAARRRPFARAGTGPYGRLAPSYVADADERKQTARRLVRESHPDSLRARGVPAEFIKVANEKLAAFNGAYEKICTERGGP